MLEQDYLMRILLQFAEAIRRSWARSVEDRDPRDAANMLERAIGDATDIDGATLLSLSPESIASVMQVSGVDPRVSEYLSLIHISRRRCSRPPGAMPPRTAG